MTLNGIKDLLPFLSLLDKNHVSYTLARYRDDSVMTTLTFVGSRVEVDFFDDHIEYSVFRGNEDVFDDQPALFEMIRAFAED